MNTSTSSIYTEHLLWKLGKDVALGYFRVSVARASARAGREPKSLYNFVPVYIHKTKNVYGHPQSLLPCYRESQSLRSLNIIIVFLFFCGEQILNFALLECGPRARVCVCVCARARVCVCARAYVRHLCQV